MSLEVFCNSLFPGWSAQNQLRQGVIAWDDNEKGLGRLLLLAAVLLLFAHYIIRNAWRTRPTRVGSIPWLIKHHIP